MSHTDACVSTDPVAMRTGVVTPKATAVTGPPPAEVSQALRGQRIADVPELEAVRETWDRAIAGDGEHLARRVDGKTANHLAAGDRGRQDGLARIGDVPEANLLVPVPGNERPPSAAKATDEAAPARASRQDRQELRAARAVDVPQAHGVVAPGAGQQAAVGENATCSPGPPSR